MARWIALTLAMALAACNLDVSPSGGETGVKFQFEGIVPNVALGSKLDIAIVDRCWAPSDPSVTGGTGKVPSDVNIEGEIQTCKLSEIQEIEDVRTAPEGILDVKAIDVSTVLSAIRTETIAVGVTTVEARVETSNGSYDLSTSYAVREPNRMLLAPRCTGRAFHEEGARVVTLANVPLPMRMVLYDGEQSLLGYDYFPIDSPFEFVESENPLENIVITPQQPGDYVIASEIDPEVRWDITVVSAETLDALSLDVTAEGCEPVFTVQAGGSGDGETPGLCAGVVDVQLSLQTPEICQFYSTEASDQFVDVGVFQRPSEVYLRPVATGTCAIAASVTGGSHRETIELNVELCEDP